MNPIHIIWAGLAFLLWSAHQHVQAVVGGHTLFSGSLLAAIALLLATIIVAVILIVIRSIIREFGPAPVRS